MSTLGIIRHCSCGLCRKAGALGCRAGQGGTRHARPRRDGSVENLPGQTQAS